jgi:hypothetical protein
VGKVIVMGGNPLGGDPLGGNPGGAGNTGLPAGYLEDVFRVARIFETLGVLQEATAGLKSITGSHAEEIKELGERHTEELRELEQQVNGLGRRHTTGLNDLGTALRREIGDLRSKLDTGETIFKLFLGALGLAVPIVWAIVSHHVSLVFH